jgi:hypothetical protein
MDRDTFLSGVAPPIDQRLAEQLFDEFVSAERRYVLGDWGPATLDGGQFAEVAARLLYSLDSATVDRHRSVDACLKYVEDQDGRNTHAFPERKAACHIARVLRTIYKFRSDRGAVHIDPTYDANHIDARLVLEGVRWVFSEMLRVCWTGDSADVAEAVREIAEFEVPAVALVDDLPRLQRVDCTAEEEVLILLHHAQDAGLSREQLSLAVPRPRSTISNALTRLQSGAVRQVRRSNDGRYRITDLGVRRVILELGRKLGPG